jgi:hypothetical protein
MARETQAPVFWNKASKKGILTAENHQNSRGLTTRGTGRAEASSLGNCLTYFSLLSLKPADKAALLIFNKPASK